jgi:hypothetical protein
MATNYLNTLIGTGCQPELAAIIADNTGVIRPDGQKAWDVDAQGDFVQQATYGGSIELTNASTAVGQPAQTGVTALGSDLAGATQLTRVSTNVTVAAAGTGVKLWDAPLGSELTVRNEASVYSPLNVYPPTASISINSRSNGTPYVLGYGESGKFTKVSSVLWIAQVGINQEVSNGVTAAGSNLATATALANPINNVATVSAGTGVALYEAAVGTRVVVRNGGNNTLLVYTPTASGTINNLSAGVAFPVNAQVVATFSKVTATVWIAEVGACQGVENGITASGTIITDAYDLTRAVNCATTVAANSGVQLFASTIGVPVYVGNGQAVNALKVWPPDASSTINGLGAGAAFSIAASSGATFVRMTSTAWVAC